MSSARMSTPNKSTALTGLDHSVNQKQPVVLEVTAQKISLENSPHLEHVKACTNSARGSRTMVTKEYFSTKNSPALFFQARLLIKNKTAEGTWTKGGVILVQVDQRKIPRIYSKKDFDSLKASLGVK